MNIDNPESEKMNIDEKYKSNIFNSFRKISEIHYHDFVNWTESISMDTLCDILISPCPYIEDRAQLFITQTLKNLISKKAKDDFSPIRPLFGKKILYYFLRDRTLLFFYDLISVLDTWEPVLKENLYKRVSNNPYVSGEEAIGGLKKIISNYQKELDNTSNSYLIEWQDMILDEYNNKKMSKEMMTICMGIINKKRKNLEDKS